VRPQLDCARWLARHTVGDQANALDFIDNVAGDLAQEFHTGGINLSSHEISGCHSAEDYDISIVALIALVYVVIDRSSNTLN
jgi:hypothetical protein